MFCTACGSELSPQGSCARCRSVMTVDVARTAAGDPFPSSQPMHKANRWEIIVFAILTLLATTMVIEFQYLQASRWAGKWNAQAIGYMLGGMAGSFLLGFLGMYIVERVRRKKASTAPRMLGIALFALLFTFLEAFGGGVSKGLSQIREGRGDANHQAGDLLKEAAGTQPRGVDVNWWDAPSRDFFHDILEMNKNYSAEVAALDSSAIKDLYSTNSYAGKVHMETVVSQLQAALAIDEKYASLDAIEKKMEGRVAAADVPEGEKQAFLKGMKNSMEKSLAPRNELVHTEEVWMKSTIDLYQFVIAHTGDYSIRDNKLYFRSDATREEFTSQQSKSIALHKDFLKAKSALEESRKSKMEQLGVSPSDLSPSQLGKPQ